MEDKIINQNKKLGFLESFLTLWIFLAIILGVSLGYVYPEIANIISSLSIGTTSIPIAIGLILMMYPPLSKVKYEELWKIIKLYSFLAKHSLSSKTEIVKSKELIKDKKLILFSLIQNWIVGPVVMWLLAILLLHDHPGYMIGVILVGLARCIAMVIVWNELAEGYRDLAVGLVALNAIFQILFYAVYIYLFITLGLKLLGFETVEANVSIIESAKTVFIYLGIPFILGLLTRYLSLFLKGKEWFENVLAPKISLLTPIFLLFTIIIMFSLKGQYIVELPLHVVRVAIPLTIYFLLMWFISFFIAYKLKADYTKAVAVAFSAASNDFELAIAVAVGIWGIGSDQAFATVIGPLLEVPVLIILVNVALFFKRKWY
jgi:ACR3 family arsenite transporter